MTTSVDVQDEWQNILSHVADIDGTPTDSDHMHMKIDYGVGINVDKGTGLPIVQSAATIGTGPGTPMCLSVRRGSRRLGSLTQAHTNAVHLLRSFLLAALIAAPTLQTACTHPATIKATSRCTILWASSESGW